MKYFACTCKINFGLRFAIWCSSYDSDHDIPDQIFREGDRLPYFKRREILEAFASQRNLPLIDEKQPPMNLDFIRTWLANPSPSKINSDEFLNAWNIFGDCAASFQIYHEKFERLTRDYLATYDKLFYGANLKSLREWHPKYTPSWTQENVAHMRHIFKMGFQILAHHSHEVGADGNMPTKASTEGIDTSPSCYAR